MGNFQHLERKAYIDWTRANVWRKECLEKTYDYILNDLTVSQYGSIYKVGIQKKRQLFQLEKNGVRNVTVLLKYFIQETKSSAQSKCQRKEFRTEITKGK